PKQTLFLSPGGAGITSMREEYEHWLQILMMVSGFVLLIVCANVANLMLLRGMGRRRQTSLSMALGARASRLVRQALTESVLRTGGLDHLEHRDFGFDAGRRTVVNFDPRLAGYESKQLTRLYRRIYDTLSGIPGVSALALCIYSPLSGNAWGAEVWVDGHPHP